MQNADMYFTPLVHNILLHYFKLLILNCKRNSYYSLEVQVRFPSTLSGLLSFLSTFYFTIAMLLAVNNIKQQFYKLCLKPYAASDAKNN